MKSVIIKNYLKVFEEFVAQTTITPGHLLKIRTDGEVQPTDVDNATVLPLFATEDELQGKSITETYSANDIVQCWIPQRGDIVYAILQNGQNVAIGEYLVSNGGGTLKKYEPLVFSSDDTGLSAPDNKVVGQAVEAVHASAGNARIKVRII